MDGAWDALSWRKYSYVQTIARTVIRKAGSVYGRDHKGLETKMTAPSKSSSNEARRVMVSESWDSRASPEQIFTLLKDISKWPSWTFANSVAMESRGLTDPYGVGAKRRIKVHLQGLEQEAVLLEEILEVVPNRRIAYAILSGMPVRDYLGETLLHRLPDGGTRIQWQSSFYPDDPNDAEGLREMISSVFQLLTRQIALAAEYPVPALTRSHPI